MENREIFTIFTNSLTSLTSGLWNFSEIESIDHVAWRNYVLGAHKQIAKCLKSTLNIMLYIRLFGWIFQMCV